MSWRKKCVELNDRFEEFAKSQGRFQTKDEVVRFLVLAICGEAGELANLVKKEWRGDFPGGLWDDKGDLTDFGSKVVGEIADIRIYLEHLAGKIHIDIDYECSKKMVEVGERLNKAGK